jgi:2-amino-4-hydroxy-6-hydroxymethyldihydropteridine diphosphokinase
MIQTDLHTAVTPTAQRVLCYIGLGSNLTDPYRQLATARIAIRNLHNVSEQAFSSVYRSKPMGPQNQPDYLNAAMAITTSLAPLQLLRALQAIEAQQGRVRTGERWGARTLDLDILLYGEQCIDMPELTIPHRGIAQRAFVLYPLYEIAPALIIPGLGRLADLLAACPAGEVERLGVERL